MRLIDADALKKDDEVIEWITKDTIRTGKTLKAFSELFVKKIDNAPTIQAVPIEVLDKIRAEIDKQIEYNTYFNSDMAKGEIIAFEWVKRKIDEYGKEQE